MELRSLIVGGSVLLLLGVAVGRYTVPEKVKIETKIVTVEKTVSDTEKDKHKNTKIVEKTLPDGTKEKVTEVVEDSSTHQHTTDDLSQQSEQKKEIVRGDSKVTVSVMAGLNPFTLPQPVYGGSITKPILGPIAVGIWGLSNGLLGASVGLTF